jgi:hypothetical protein
MSLVGKRKQPLSAKDLGYDVAEIIAERGDPSKPGMSHFDRSVRSCLLAASLAAVDECEWAHQYRLLHSRAGKAAAAHPDARGVTKAQAWARVRAGCAHALRHIALSYQPHARRALERAAAAIGGAAAKGADGATVGQKVAGVLRAKEAGAKVVQAVAKAGLAGLTDVFIELGDSGDVKWDDMGDWDDWANYRYKVRGGGWGSEAAYQEVG